MLKVIVLFFLFVQILFAQTYPYFNEKNLLKIEKKYSKIAKNRVLDYQQHLKRFKTLPKSKQLNSVNFYLNQLISQYDSVSQKCEDYWKTPVEFLVSGSGDCEDYAIIKYYTLVKLGFDKRKLFLTVVVDKYSKTYHMVLSYFDKKNFPPLILDNLSFKILRLDKRDDLEVKKLLNEYGVYKLDKNYKLVKLKTIDITYMNFLQKIKKEKRVYR